MATVPGTSASDTLFGTSASDTVLGFGGDDRLSSGSGDDFVDGGGLNDAVYGGSGNDTLLGWKGDDRLTGGNDDDSVYGGDGNDVVAGWFGDDRVSGGCSEDSLSGGAGTDVVLGGNGNDTIFGGQGSDSLYGGNEDDALFGERLSGGAGNDTLVGLSSDDDLFGGSGADSIDGHNGNDFINGGSGNDTIAGGGGSDIVTLQLREDVDIGIDFFVDFSPGDDVIDLNQEPGGLTFGQIDTNDDGRIDVNDKSAIVVPISHEGGLVDSLFIDAGKAFGGDEFTDGIVLVGIEELDVFNTFGDDGDSAATGGVINSGFRFGDIATEDDKDWYGVTLTGGVTYDITVKGEPTGDGTLSDPFLRVYDSTEMFLQSDDDSGSGRNSALLFTPTASGYFYLEASGFDGAMGTYLMEVQVT